MQNDQSDSCIFEFLCCTVDRKHLISFQSKTSVFKFLQHSVDVALIIFCLNFHQVPARKKIPLDFHSFTISYFKLSYFEFPATSNPSFLPYTLNQPHYFELVKSRVQEEALKQPTKSEVHQASETLSCYSLFAVEGAEIRWQTSHLSFTIDKSIRKNQKQQNIQKFFNATTSVDT